MYRNLRAEMARNGMSQKDVSQILNISEGSFHNKLNGKTEFTLREAFALKETLCANLDIHELFRWTP